MYSRNCMGSQIFNKDVIFKFTQFIPNENIIVVIVAKVKNSILLLTVVSSSKNTLPCMR